MLIRFWFGAIHIGRPSGLGDIGDYDASITWCWGRRRYETPPGELQWRLVARFAWNWWPDVIYQMEPRALTSREVAVNRMIATISGKEPGLLDSEYAHETEHAPRIIGFGDWRHAGTVYRSNRRSQVYVYLTGAKERGNPSHILRVCPGALVPKNEVPAEWMEDGEFKKFELNFVHGRCSVDEQLGKLLIEKGIAQKTNLIRRTGSTLGSLAATIRGA